MKNADLAKLLTERSYLTASAEKPFKLASGRTSQFYFDCQATTMFADAMPLIGRAFLEHIRTEGKNPLAVGGLTRGADPIAQAIARESLDSPPVLNSFSVRKQRKDHGTSRWIEGCASPGMRVVIVDDVITSGGSVIQAIDSAEDERLKIVQVIVLVDREEGGLKAIKDRVPDVPVSAIFLKSELDRKRGIDA
ncbi:MAG: orotate phosphoribosyltransferase [Myxococcota bacterium]